MLIKQKLLQSRAGLSQGIQFVGYADLTVNSSTTLTSTISLTSLTGGIDTAPIKDDIIILIGSGGGSAGVASNFTSGLAAGGGLGPHTSDGSLPWNAELCNINSNDTNDCQLVIGWERAGVTPPTSVVVVRGEEANDFCIYQVLVFRGVSTTTAIDTTTVTATGLNGIAANPPSITPVTAGAVILAVGASSRDYADTRDMVGSSDMTQLVASSMDAGNASGTNGKAGQMITMIKTDWTSGAFNPAAYTGTGDSADCWCAATIALRPA